MSMESKNAQDQLSPSIADLSSSDLTDLDLVALAYLLILQRPLDPTGQKSWTECIRSGNFSPAMLLETLQASPEFKMLNRTPFSTLLHQARQQWVKKLPAAEAILDIGGSSPNIAEGALVELGYPHRPKELCIYDLPPSEQYWGQPRFPQDRDYNFAWGRLYYAHGQAEEIAECGLLREKAFDLVFMGQTIEHIQPDALPRVLNWIYAHLRPKGRLVFDTPNRLLTKLQSPQAYIDQDHKMEYTPRQLEDLVTKSGFAVTSRHGLLPMPNSRQSGNFNPLEVYEQPAFSDDIESCYVFAFDCCKP